MIGGMVNCENSIIRKYSFYGKIFFSKNNLEILVLKRLTN